MLSSATCATTARCSGGDEGNAPLAEAAKGGHVDAVRALLAAGAEVNRLSKVGLCRLTP